MTEALLKHIVGKVNVPYQHSLGADALAAALDQGDFKLAQVGSFFTEIDPADQKGFAEHHDISPAALSKTANSFADWSGQEVALAS